MDGVFGLWHLSPAPGVGWVGSWPPPLLPQIQIDGGKMKLVFLKNEKKEEKINVPFLTLS